MPYLHIIPSYNVQSQHYLLNSLWRTEHSFMAFIQNQVNGLIKTFEGSLKTNHKNKALQLPFKFTIFPLKGIWKRVVNTKVLENRCSIQLLFLGLNTNS